MIRKLMCSNGMVFAKADGIEATVDEVIDFLEQFRGLRFWNGASGDVAFRLDNECVCCDSADFHVECASRVDEALGEMVCNFFFTSSIERITEEEWRTRHADCE